jgi:CRP-like cAMP-binding protein
MLAAFREEVAAMSTDARTLELLAAVPPFDRCGRQELAEVARRTSIVDEPVGAVLMRQGESGTEMAIIIEGRVAIVRNDTVIAERGPGEVLGEMALLSGMPRTATVIVLVTARLLLISRPDFDVLMADLPSFRSQVLESLARRARDL